MEGDFTRDTFDPYRHYTRVFMQQGRVQLDADWNEQASINEHYLRTVVADLVGPHGGPTASCGFAIITDNTQVPDLRGPYGTPLRPERIAALQELLDKGDFVIGTGRYYVDGMLCENDDPVTYTEQRGYPYDDATTLAELRGAGTFLLYLDVWERHVSYLEEPGLRELALEGPDTATRAQLVWQVKVLRADADNAPANLDCTGVDGLPRLGGAMMRARARQPETSVDACVVDPQARYRGAENQLYRVEIHRGGPALADGAKSGGATFKWSRENASVALAVLNRADDVAAGTVTVGVGSLGRDRRLGLTEGDWVELVDDGTELRGDSSPLLLTHAVDRDELEVTLEGTSASTAGTDRRLHPLLRRWDHDAAGGDEGALVVAESADEGDGWIDLEDGVQVQFPGAPVAGEPIVYHAGDYWLVPARTATGDVEWPRSPDGETVHWEPRPARGVVHHYAPLALATIKANGEVDITSPDCRCRFASLPCENNL